MITDRREHPRGDIAGFDLTQNVLPERVHFSRVSVLNTRETVSGDLPCK